MSRKHVAIFVILGVIVAIIGGRALLGHRAYVGDLERLHQREMRNWVNEKQGMAARLDLLIAEALVAPDEDTLSEVLGRASDTAWEGREVMIYSSLITEVNMAIDRWHLRQAYERAGSYLYYLSNKEGIFPLTSVEVDNLELIRTYAEVLFTGFNELVERIIYHEELPSGSTTLKYHPWRKILKDETMVSVIDAMGSDVNILPSIGEKDSAYQDYLIAGRAGSEEIVHGLAFSKEEVYDQEALIEMADAFLQTLATGPLTHPSPPPSPTGNAGEGGGRAISGWGEDRFIGEYILYDAEDKESLSQYTVQMTHIGGHIYELMVKQRDSAATSLEEAIGVGEEVLARWVAYENVTLELVQTESLPKSNEAHFVYALVVEGVVTDDQQIRLRVSLDDQQTLIIVLNAFRYFTLYNYPHNYTPQLTTEEASATLSPQLTLAGSPRLEIRRGTLTYAIPVSGVKWVDKVYIDAVTGQYLDMKYDYARPRQ